MVRQGYPRPRFVRARWLSLNGPWSFSFDEPTFDREIIVPFAPEWPASTLGDPRPHSVVWYRRTFEVPDGWSNDRVWLRFGAVDHSCEVWVNGTLVGTHDGGHTPFGCDITAAVGSSTNE